MDALLLEKNGNVLAFSLLEMVVVRKCTLSWFRTNTPRMVVTLIKTELLGTRWLETYRVAVRGGGGETKRRGTGIETKDKTDICRAEQG